jgi:4-aminobutyrate--pyruvate transaminase
MATTPNLPNSPIARDIAFALHPYTNLRKHQAEGSLIIREGKGIHVYDEGGTEYIEAVAGLWSASLGFGGEERLVEAAAKAMRKLPFYHQFGAKAHEPGIDLAERLIELAPVPMSKVFFTNSGSEANDTAVKIVWYYNNALGRPEKKKIIARTKGYHGVTVAAASLTGLPHLHKHFDLPIANILHTSCPHHYRFAETGESEEDFSTRLAADLEKLILDEGPETVAAFIAEPVMGAGGAVPPPATYFEKVQAVLKKYDVLFIADEVICGFMRTGNYWGSQTYGLKPDMIVCAKALSASYLPIAAIMLNEKVFQGLVQGSDDVGLFAHGYTYSGHPVACAVALETLKIYDDRDILGHVRAMAPNMLGRMHGFADHPLVGEVRGVGMVGAIELVRDKNTKEAFDPKLAVGAYLNARAQARGLILRPLGDSIAFSPPLVIDEANLNVIFDRFGAALDETHAWLSKEGVV